MSKRLLGWFSNLVLLAPLLIGCMMFSTACATPEDGTRIDEIEASAEAAVSEGLQDVEVSISLVAETEETNEDASSGDAADEETCDSTEACDKKACDSEDKAECDSGESTVAKKKSSGGLFSIFGRSKNSEADEAAESLQATHKQVALLKVKPQAGDNEGWGVKSFCLDADDNLLVAVGGQKGQLQSLSPEGEVLSTWDLPVVPEAVNVDPAGNTLVAGAGKIYQINSEGETLLEAESPLMASVNENREQLRQEVVDQMKSTYQSMQRQQNLWKSQIDNLHRTAAGRLDHNDQNEYRLLTKRLDGVAPEQEAEMSLDEQNAMALRRILHRMLQAKVDKQITKQERRMIEAYEEQLGYCKQYLKDNDGSDPTEEQIEAAMQSSMSYKMKCASISSDGTDVFVATGAMKGYGFDVWRMDARFENPEKIVSGLRGCCGQMDVQACEKGLYVAENSRHQVRHFDRTGEKVNQWGGRDRGGVEGFGSCCNPMNVAFGPDGSVYTAESGSGRIKQFTPEGKLVSLIGSVELVPGCKKVSIAVTKDGSRVYMLDITRNHIIVMEAQSSDEKIVAK